MLWRVACVALIKRRQAFEDGSRGGRLKGWTARFSPSSGRGILRCSCCASLTCKVADPRPTVQGDRSRRLFEHSNAVGRYAPRRGRCGTGFHWEKLGVFLDTPGLRDCGKRQNDLCRKILPGRQGILARCQRVTGISRGGVRPADRPHWRSSCFPRGSRPLDSCVVDRRHRIDDADTARRATAASNRLRSLVVWPEATRAGSARRGSTSAPGSFASPREDRARTEWEGSV
jgi:hypothetical protein